MADGITSKVTGLDRLANAFKRLQGIVRGNYTQNAVYEAAQLIQNEAIRRAPYRSGTLKRSIHIKMKRHSRIYVTAEVGTDLDYAMFVEFGTSRMSAQPYLRPAFDMHHNPAVKAMADQLAQQIENVS